MNRTSRIRKPRREEGFAMLLVFAMAAAVAILLYKEMPRVAFQSQRNREQMLIERGEQYKRGIQLYFRKHKRYPATLDDLESTNNIRFLRRRYKDPLTGKDEWKLIQIDAAGAFTNSLVQKNAQGKDPKTQVAGMISGTIPLGGIDPQAAAGAMNPALMRRASDRPAIDANAPAENSPSPGDEEPRPDPNNPNQPPIQTYPVPGQPYQQQQPGQPVQPGQLVPGQPFPFQQFPGQPGQPFPTPGQQPFFPGQPSQIIPGRGPPCRSSRNSIRSPSSNSSNRRPSSTILSSSPTNRFRTGLAPRSLAASCRRFRRMRRRTRRPAVSRATQLRLEPPVLHSKATMPHWI